MFDRIRVTIDNLSAQKLLLPLVLVAALSLFVFVVIISILSPRTENPQGSPTPTPSSSVDRLPQEQRISVLQKSAIGETTQKELDAMPGLENKSTFADGSTRYAFRSALISRKNEVLVKDGKAVFERILTPESSKARGYSLISQFTKRYGEPEETITGSSFYGQLMSNFIYANKGFTLIGNPFTGEVFEIQLYVPTTVETYRQQYGEDIKEPDGSFL
jgi:hypothetical protein